MLEFHVYPLEPKNKYQTKNRLAKPSHGMPERTHDSRTRHSVRSATATRHSIEQE